MLKAKHTSSHLYSAKHLSMCWVWLASKGLMRMLKCLLIQRLTTRPSQERIPRSDTLSSLPKSPSPTVGFMPYTTIGLWIFKLSHFHWANILRISENCTKDRIKTTSPEQSVIHLICIAVSIHNTTEGKKGNVLNWVHNCYAKKANAYISITSVFL